MAKLPDNFVKPPSATSRLTTRLTAPKHVRRPRKAELEEEAVNLVTVRLSPAEYAALAAACDAFAAVGETVSIEEMMRQVIARWMAATLAMQAPGTGSIAPAARKPVRSTLRRLARQPISHWRALGEALRRSIRQG
jgi:hypothetical protein